MEEPRRIAVAYSGGRDSTALLHVTAQVCAQFNIEVHALHVHHGLNPKANEWMVGCEQQCADWTAAGWPVHFHAWCIRQSPPRGESVEAWARAQRYQALHEMAMTHRVRLILLAHHRRDQAETVVLQALRGGGVAGLAGMPRITERGGLLWARPWIGSSREAIDVYVSQHGLSYVDDESNGNARFARNRLRKLVWPALTEAFPSAEISLTEAARHAQWARRCLDEAAQQDLAAVASPRGLSIAKWKTLPEGRRHNALRAWVRSQTGWAVPSSLAQRLFDELARPGAARWPAAGGELRRYRGLLRYAVSAAALPPIDAVPARESLLNIEAPGRIDLPGWGGVLHASSVRTGGLPLSDLAGVSLRERGGGERFQLETASIARSLKKQYQAKAVAEWERQGPLLYQDDRLLFVPGLGIDARARAAAGVPQVRLRWTPSR